MTGLLLPCKSGGYLKNEPLCALKDVILKSELNTSYKEEGFNAERGYSLNDVNQRFSIPLVTFLKLSFFLLLNSSVKNQITKLGKCQTNQQTMRNVLMSTSASRNCQTSLTSVKNRCYRYEMKHDSATCMASFTPLFILKLILADSWGEFLTFPEVPK